jgi:hypothetical protein
MRTRQWLATAGVIAVLGTAPAGIATAEPAAGVTPDAIDTLIVPIGQITPRMDYTTVQEGPSPSPPAAQGGPNPSDSCYFDALQPDAAELFGTGLQAFRDVNYSGVGNILVNQAIGVYPDAAAATAVVGRLTDGLSACRASAPAGLTIGALSPAGAAWSGSICADEARAVRNVAIRVQACHMDSPAAVAASVADAISARVDNAN